MESMECHMLGAVPAIVTRQCTGQQPHKHVAGPKAIAWPTSDCLAPKGVIRLHMHMHGSQTGKHEADMHLSMSHTTETHAMNTLLDTGSQTEALLYPA
jgi:hypothetical protein